MVAPQCGAELTRQLAQKTTSEQVKGIVKNLLLRAPGAAGYRQELPLSTRTLQRTAHRMKVCRFSSN